MAEPRAGCPRPAGEGVLRVVRAGGRSVAAQVYATSPLRLLTPANHGHAAWIFTSSFGGGLVDGDRLAIRVSVDAGAAAYLSTQASTKVYKSRRGTASSLCAAVGPGALLVVLPDPVVCFTEARYTQVQQYDVAMSGGLIVLDWLTSGRHRSGERWAFARYESRLVIRVDGRELAHDATALRSADGSVADRLGRFNVIATLALAGSGVTAEAAAVAARAGEVARTVAGPRSATGVPTRTHQLTSVAPLDGGGCLVRIAGTSFESVAATVRDLLEFLPARLGDSPWHRKW
jgi:urease accessory protein